MKILRVETGEVRMRLAEPYTIAYESVAEATNVLLRLVTETHVGLGCAAPDPVVTGESPASVVEVLSERVAPELTGADPLRRERLHERLAAPLADHPSARAALDMALWDLLGKSAGLPVWRLLGGHRRRIETSVTIGILPERETVESARGWLERGFRCLKLKGGLDAEADAVRVRRVREAVGPDVELRFDANQGYSVEQSLRFVRETSAARLELLEPAPACWGGSPGGWSSW